MKDTYQDNSGKNIIELHSGKKNQRSIIFSLKKVTSEVMGPKCEDIDNPFKQCKIPVPTLKILELFKPAGILRTFISTPQKPSPDILWKKPLQVLWNPVKVPDPM
jgi:hypothetical protein